MTQIKLVIATHGYFGIELVHSAEMLVGPMHEVYHLSLVPSDNFETFVAKADTLLTSLRGPFLVLVDLNGGTPANAMTFLTQRFPARVITGLNLPMLLDCYLKINKQQSLTLTELVQTCLQVGTQAIIETTAKYHSGKS